MKKLSETLTEMGIAFRFPIRIEDCRGNDTYYEGSDGYWWKCEYDDNGNPTYCEDSYGDKDGTPRSQSRNGKVIEMDGKKYQLKELI